MKLTKEFAEILGMFAADGCIQDKYICMWGNLFADKEYYDKVVCPLFSQVFNIQVKAHEKKSNSVYGFYVCNHEIINIFRNMGFTKNKTYDVNIPQAILESSDNKIFAAFIRGYADCDGSINFLRRKGKYKLFKTQYNTYPRVQIISVSHQVIHNISNLLNKLKIKHTFFKRKPNNINEKEALEIAIRGNSRVKSFMDNVGFNNPAQISKYLIWQKFGMCPPKTTHEQRGLILQNKLNPFTIKSNRQVNGNI